MNNKLDKNNIHKEVQPFNIQKKKNAITQCFGFTLIRLELAKYYGRNDKGVYGLSMDILEKKEYRWGENDLNEIFK